MQTALPSPAGDCWHQLIEAAQMRQNALDDTDRAAADALAATMATWNEDELSDYWQSVASQLSRTVGRTVSGFLDVEIVALSQLARRLETT